MADIRDKKGVTLREVSEKTGLSISYLCDLENDRRHWTAELVDRYLRALK